MDQKLAGKKCIILLVMAVLLAGAGVYFARSTMYGFYAALKTCIAAAGLACVYLVMTRGIHRILWWIADHRRRLLHVLILEGGLLFYMYFFVHKIKNVITLYQSAQMTFGFLVMMLIAAAALLTETGKIPVQRIYLFLGIALGVMFLFMQPVGSIPDEKAHLYASYDVSNTMLGISRTPDGHILMRSDDAAYRLREYSNAHNFSLYWEAIDDPAIHEEVLDIGRKPLSTQKYQYFMPGLGLTAGRLLHFGAAGTFFLGRLFNMLGFVLVTAYAIRCLPFGKIILMLLALMPMSLQQASSFSYDAFVNSVAFLVVALTLRLAYGEEEASDTKKAKRWHVFHMIVLLASCLLLLPVKGYAYAPLCFLPLLLVFRKWKTNRREALFYIGILAACVVMFGVLRILPLMQKIGTPVLTPAGTETKQLYSLGYLRSHPYEWVYVLLNTSRNSGAFYLESMLVSPMGVLTKPVNTVLVYICVVVLMLASLKKKNESVILGKAAKGWIQITAWASVACILVGMLFAYTDVNYQMIAGVQGRYFIPVVFPMLLTIRSEKICTEQSIDGPLLSVVLTCVFFVVHYLIT